MRILLLIPLAILINCQSGPSSDQVERWKEEIRQAEAEFAAMADSVGIAEAFEHFSAEDGVIKRSGQLLHGKQSIFDFYQSNPINGTLEWAPDFIDVSQSGDLGYTYGEFTLTITDSTGKESINKGTFHTVWKRQADGSWKYVWD